MTLFESFAAAALTGLCANPEMNNFTEKAIATMACDIAKALQEEVDHRLEAKRRPPAPMMPIPEPRRP